MARHAIKLSSCISAKEADGANFGLLCEALSGDDGESGKKELLFERSKTKRVSTPSAFVIIVVA
ncbi:hypothetical protein [uncultured Bacteroides sp.]|uniref:hypothetical protein n=1 Tax=uncultured Bacteroides sp. TaxID=162156 RepID=UPI002AA76580|nr:hypothetical protein [uncultured Bacteroides sp.]